MRTLQFELSIQTRAIVPEQFLEGQLEAARDPDRTEFQKQLIEKYDNNVASLEAIYPEKEGEGYTEGMRQAGDHFLIELLANGLRKGVRGHVVAMFESSGLGATVAPAKTLEAIAILPEIKEDAVES